MTAIVLGSYGELRMAALHEILFNMQTMYSFALGAYAAFLAARNQSISGNFWGSIAIYVILNIGVLLVGLALFVQGGQLAEGANRIGIYFLYMAFLIVIMPGLFSMLRGRDDRNAAVAFSVLALFNASVSFSMFQRGLAVWVAAS